MLDPPDPSPVLTPEQETAANFMCLVANLRRAKATEEQAKNNRIKLEEMVAALVPGSESGQVTAAASDGTKVIVKRGFNYKADCPGIQKSCDGMTLAVPIKSKTTYELDIEGYEWYRKNDPDAFCVLAKHVTVTPKKVSVTLK